MKIVITNEAGLTESHLEKLRPLGQVEVYNDTNLENFSDRMKDAEIAMIDCFVTPVTADLLAKAPQLKFFTLNSTGYDQVSVSAVQERGILAANVPGFSTTSVAELAIGLIFAVARKIPAGDSAFRQGLHAADPGTPAAEQFMGFNLEGKTLGVIGLGNIGLKVAQKTLGLGLQVVAYNRSEKQVPNVKLTSLEELMSDSDIVVNCLALNAETTGVLNSTLLQRMKNTAIFISIAGMEIVDQDALLQALQTRAIAGAGLDTADARFSTAPNTVLTPHIGYNTKESQENMGRLVVENIEAYIQGKPVNIIA
jgi:phosphoglycerate dehydrogenase-like enzyme